MLRAAPFTVHQVDPAQRPTASELLLHPWVASTEAARGGGAGPSTSGGGVGGGGER
jgi:hypothetical protein